MPRIVNPFRPGAGHMPPYLAGREQEKDEFRRLLGQSVILENLVLTGLRGVGKTVLLDTFKPIAIGEGWLWAGTDLSESTTLSEQRVATRLMADLAVITSSLVVTEEILIPMGFAQSETTMSHTLTFENLVRLYERTPGLVSDKLKRVLEFAWECLQRQQRIPRGIIFAYDEAQNMSDQSAKDEFPLSLMLDVFQSIQKKGIPFMLVMVGLPTLFPNLVEARTFAERMFHVVFLDSLTEAASRDAILKPIEASDCGFPLDSALIDEIISTSGGYPYFIQFICREVYDAALHRFNAGQALVVPMEDIIRKLDTDFFAGRWAKATDRQRELLTVVAHLVDGSDKEFTVSQVAEKSKGVLKNPFSSSHINQMFATLADAGLIYKNRHGRYSFAVPLFAQFILRQEN